MKTEHMREFIELVHTGNYSRAAEKFYLSQSALSKHMAVMEGELNTPLLDHSNNAVKLTEAGEYALQEMEKIVQLYDSMQKTLDKMREGVKGKLTLGLLYYAAEDFFLPIIRRFKASYTEIELHTVSGQPERVFRDITDGAIDGGFLTSIADTPEDYGRDFFMQKLYSERGVLLCRKDHPFAQKEKVFVADLNGQVYLRYEDGTFMQKYNDMVIKLMERNGASLREIVCIDNVDFTGASIYENEAVIIMPEHIKKAHPKLAAVPVMDFPKIDTSFCYRADNKNPSLNLFLNMLTCQTF